MIAGLIFDFDGVILDTETPEYEALNEVYRDHGQFLPVEMYGLVVGSQYDQNFEPVAHLQKLTGRTLDADKFWQRVNQRRLEIIHASQPLPGVEACLREARARGLKLAVASSSSHSWVDGHLHRLGFFHYFDVIKAQEDVRHIKPDPELFLSALQALGLQASQALIFEDSLNGVLAAQRAGIRVVTIPNPVTLHLNIKGETLRLASLADLPLPVLLEQVNHPDRQRL
jgi:putative hydrolase of the HAD superfamily